jgi:hypothetical protein
MADTVTLRTRKFMRNALLARKQMVVYVFAPSLLAWGLEMNRGRMEFSRSATILSFLGTFGSLAGGERWRLGVVIEEAPRLRNTRC